MAAILNEAKPSPLGTPAQAEAERRVLTILASPEVRAARAEALAVVARHPVARTAQGAARLESTIDHWMGQYGLKLAAEGLQPGFIWMTSLAPYSWMGHDFPGASTALDDPNSTYRTTWIDGSSSYVVTGRIPRRSGATLNFQLAEHAPGVAFSVVPGRKTGDRAAIISTIIDEAMDIDADGRFTITVDPSPADGRPNHVQTTPGRDMALMARETFSDWQDLRSTELAIEEIGCTRAKSPVQDQIDEMAASLPGYVQSILDYLDTYDDSPPVNTISQPHMRVGAFGFGAPLRFELDDDQAIIVTMTDARAAYFGVQITDIWMNPLSPLDCLSTYNLAQSERGEDGLFTYVVSHRDPQVPNWIETQGLRQGFVYLRWQGVPPEEIGRGDMILRYDVVPFADVAAPGDAQDWRQRREAERRERARQWRLRLWADGDGA